MKKHHQSVGGFFWPTAGVSWLVAVLAVLPNLTHAAETASLMTFSTERELKTYFEEFKKSIVRARSPSNGTGVSGLDTVIVTGSMITSITNNQSDGVDEGGIVKVHGDYLVVLRRGRLFTVALQGGELRPVSWIDAFGPGMNPENAWYDEMLIYQDRVIVIGYSYGSGGTDLGFFRIDTRGKLSYEATYQLKSDDYYSSRNYASRLVGSKLVFYSPLSFTGDINDLPSLRKWREFSRSRVDVDSRDRDDQDAFERIAAARRVYRPTRTLTADDDPTLHTITTCDLAQIDVKCTSIVAIGPEGHVFYVSATAVYVWMGGVSRSHRHAAVPGLLYRMPLDGSNPTAMQVVGLPVDQFSFLEAAGYLNVLVRSDGDGEGMWSSEVAEGDTALLRTALTNFGAGNQRFRRNDYRPLPKPEDGSFHNRFIGNRLLYGSGDGWGFPQGGSATLFAVDVKGGEVVELSFPHTVDRIEPMAGNAVIVGTDSEESLYFSGVALNGKPRAIQRHVVKKAAQGELRSHGFFYKSNGLDNGMLGLPIRGAGAPGYEHLTEDSASIVFINNANGQFAELGRLVASEVGDTDDDSDACRASCVDWYGNARPVFLHNRIFALLGYDLVEGSLRGNRLIERQRTTFAPLIDHR